MFTIKTTLNIKQVIKYRSLKKKVNKSQKYFNNKTKVQQFPDYDRNQINERVPIILLGKSVISN